MSNTQSTLKIQEIAPRFAQLLKNSGTSLENPTLDATWRAFAIFGVESIDCDDERLLFEAELSGAQPDSFYVHFSRTCYGREPGHIWSHEVICDFVFGLDDTLETFGCTFEADDLAADEAQRTHFFAQVEKQSDLWAALGQRTPLTGEIYIGES